MTGAGAAAASLLRGPRSELPEGSIFEEEPVPLDVFVQDRAYLGNPPLSEVQYDAVLHAERIFYPETYTLLAGSADRTIREYWSQPVRMVNFLEMEWGKGGGKDHTCRMIAMRVCYLLLCLTSPQDYYAMPEQDSIHCLNVASSSKQASRAFFTPMRRAVTRRGCWFVTHANVDVVDASARQSRGRAGGGEGMQALLDTIRFEKNIEAVSGHSDADSQEGLNLILGIADEIDAFRSRAELAKLAGNRRRESSSSAEAILEMLRTSASTRFPAVYKNVHISYPRYLGSTIQQLVAEGVRDLEKRGAESRYYVSGPLATWEANPRVPGPEAFAKDYEDDPVLARAKYECKPARAVNPYFANEIALRECFVPVTQEPVTVDYVREAATWRPVYNFSSEFYPVSGARYAMHADLASSGDRAGIALAHVKTWQDHVLLGSDSQGLEVSVPERRPVVKVDFVFSYSASASAVPPREIQIRWARLLCLELRRMGFPIVRFTFDQYQCVSSQTRIVTLPRPTPSGRITDMELLNGESVTIEEMARRYDAGETEQWVYSCTPDGRIVPGRCTKAWCTGEREDMVEVELDNGEKVRTTSDHRWMLRDGTYQRADLLQPGDSLMPLYRRARKPGSSKLDYGKQDAQANNHKVVAVRASYPERVYDLQVEEHHNFAIGAGVFVHNSKDSMQILESHGIETDRFSTDVSEEGWRTLRDVAYEGRLMVPQRELVITELLGLSRLPNGKIDHLGDGSKDEADGLAGAVAGALEVGGEEDPSGLRAYPGEHQFYGPHSADLAPLGMPAGRQLGPEGFLPLETSELDRYAMIDPLGALIDDFGGAAEHMQ